MQATMICPKCGYSRTPTETAPAWQCPNCGIAYAKYAAYLQYAHGAAKKIVVPRKAGENAPHISLDGSVWFLVGANVLALVIAYRQGWPLASLMLLYWGQSVVIGISNIARILSLEKFSTEKFTINGEPIEPTTETKWKVAGFFALHYGIFHIVYLSFLLDQRSPPPLDREFWLCIAVFAVNHMWSYRYNRDLDRQGVPNIGTLMMTPYVRIVPMHLTIMLGGMMGGGLPGKSVGLLVFGGLKTVADVLMHIQEHQKIGMTLKTGIAIGK
jgi:hypothetical protein